MTIEQAAEYLQIGADDVRELIEGGSLPAVRLLNDVWRVPKSALDEWLRTMAYCNVPGKPQTSSDAEHALSDVRRHMNDHALERADRLRERILERRGGEPFAAGYSAELIREGRDER
ncbi:MAG: helix-turn-helix domain-containing protein [Armatimonadota bacterium]|nr:helix-turn-helix domain-containing protein [Armatimonadota bacterium]